MYEQVDRYRQAWADSPVSNGEARPTFRACFSCGRAIVWPRSATTSSPAWAIISRACRHGPGGVDAQSGSDSYRYLQEVQKSVDSLTFETMTQNMAIFGSPARVY